MRLGGYGRVSGREQALGMTVETQIDAVEPWARARDDEMVDWYLDCPCSNKIPIADRKEGARLLRDAAAGKFDAVVVHIFDRWSRQDAIWKEGRELLRQHGVELLCVTDDLSDETPSQRLGLDVKLDVAKYAADQTAFNCLNGKYRRSKEPSNPGGVCPYGMRIVPYPEAGKGRTRRVPDSRPIRTEEASYEYSEADVIAWLFTWRIEERLTYVALCRRLNDRGVPTACQIQKDGHHRHHMANASGVWTPATLAKMLKNPLYKGQPVYGRLGKSRRPQVSGPVPAIVAPDLWERAQQVSLQNEKWAPRNGVPNRYLLTGKLLCEHCGYHLGGRPATSRGHTYFYYLCKGRQNGYTGHAADLAGCPLPHVPAKRLEADLWEKLEAHVRDHEATLERIRERWANEAARSGAIAKERDRLVSLIRRKESAIRNTISLMTVPDEAGNLALTRAQGQEQLAHLRAEIEAHQAQVATLDAAREEAVLSEAKLLSADSFLRRWREKLDEPMTAELRRAVVDQFVESIHLRVEDGAIVARYRFCDDPDREGNRLHLGATTTGHSGSSVQILSPWAVELIQPLQAA